MSPGYQNDMRKGAVGGMVGMGTGYGQQERQTPATTSPVDGELNRLRTMLAELRGAAETLANRTERVRYSKSDKNATSGAAPEAIPPGALCEEIRGATHQVQAIAGILAQINSELTI